MRLEGFVLPFPFFFPFTDVHGPNIDAEKIRFRYGGCLTAFDSGPTCHPTSSHATFVLERVDGDTASRHIFFLAKVRIIDAVFCLRLGSN
jgi:hypothetical protein